MSATGFLVTHAYTSDASIPVSGAAVLVSRTQAGLSELLAMRLTDESGKTPPLTLETPDLAESLSPHPGQPFAVVTVTVEHPDYTRIIVENVQIFPGETAIAELQLIPLDEQPALWNETEQFTVPPQML